MSRLDRVLSASEEARMRQRTVVGLVVALCGMLVLAFLAGLVIFGSADDTAAAHSKVMISAPTTDLQQQTGPVQQPPAVLTQDQLREKQQLTEKLEACQEDRKDHNPFGAVADGCI